MILGGTGHRYIRPENGSTRLVSGTELEMPLRELLHRHFDRLMPERFIGGGALGFDMVATDVARERGIPYTLALPYLGFDDRWNDQERERLHGLSQEADEVRYVSAPGYSRHKMERRNHYIVDNSDQLIALWDGRKSGTGNCILYAWSRRRPVENIWREFSRITS